MRCRPTRRSRIRRPRLVRQLPSAGTPAFAFTLRCALTRAEVEAQYALGAEEADEPDEDGSDVDEALDFDDDEDDDERDAQDAEDDVEGDVDGGAGHDEL